MGDHSGLKPGALTGLLSLVTDIKKGEAKRALALTLNFFLLFTAYYTIKPIREALILSLENGAEIKSAASGYQALAFMVIVPVYSVVASRFSGRGILIFVYLFLTSNLFVFIYLNTISFQYLSVLFFLWVGMFNLLTISQTWSLCNDIYTEEQGKRLFPLIAFGAASGAVFGPLVFGSVTSSDSLTWPLLIAAALLIACSALVRFSTPEQTAKQLPVSLESTWKRLSGGFGLVFTNRYLVLIAFLVLIINLVNTNSEYMLGKLVAEHAKEQVAAGLAEGATVNMVIGAFFARFFFWVNLIVLVMQLFVVSRVVRYYGVHAALFALPILALLSYSIILILPILPIIRVVKIMENATDYSLNNTSREILFLPLSRNEKYKAKIAIDTFFWRGGDALSNVAVRIITGIFGLGITAFAGLNAVLVIVWLFIVYRIMAYRRKNLPNSRLGGNPS
jgi:AAA family ATP:ADP antiporter